MSERELLSAFGFTRKTQWPRDFLAFDAGGFERLLRTKNESFWRALGERRALALFHSAARRVPAYKDFLKQRKVRPERVKTIRDFARVPLTDKRNYIDVYPLRERLWDGKLPAAHVVAVSSGTTGEPKFWPRGGFQEFEAAVTHEFLYRSLFDVGKRPTLLIIGFPMGVYVSGVATLLPTWLTATKVKNLTVIAAGNSKSEVLRVARHIPEDYGQIVLVGHPFFIKDVIETGRGEGVRWSRHRVRLLFCSEGFSESWRTYVMREAGVSPESLDGAFSVYGSSELLLTAYETPLTVFIQRLGENNNRFRERLVGSGALPSVFQYNPLFRYIESVSGNLIFTSASGVPLIRFDLKDAGRVIGFGEMTEALRGVAPQWRKEISRRAPGRPLWRLPFVTLGGRSDHTVVFYAANIYPEHVRSALQVKPFFKKLTGKFSLRKGYKRNMDEFLEIHVELRAGVGLTKQLRREVQKRIADHLLNINMEYRFLWGHLDKDIRPRVKLWPYQHPKYFKPGLKPRYIIGE